VGSRRGLFSCARTKHAGALAHARSQLKEKVMRFQKGQSGNPAGRPRGTRNKSTVLLQNMLEGEAEAITRKVIALAKEGDMAAIKHGPARAAAP